MLEKLLAGLGLGSSEPAPAPIPTPAAPPYRPYKEEVNNSIYNLLFCDDRSLFATPEATGEPWDTVLAAKPDAGALRAIADDASREGRVRMLAFNRLREIGQPTPRGILLGVIVEVGLDDGLDVLAAFTDPSARYINQSGRMAFFEGAPPSVIEKVRTVLAEGQKVVDLIGPWTGHRLPPPPKDTVRMTFLVSDGLYLGQGPFPEMLNEPMARGLLGASQDLLLVVVATFKQQPA